jgi:iron complex transport system ATP-binding protein
MTEKNSCKKTRNPPLLEFENLTVIKGDKNVLESLTVTIHEGEHIAILGPNGAGKSSFIKAVNREYYPQLHEGVVFRIRGEEVWDVFAMRSFFGIVSNDLQFAYTREVSGREVILSGFFSSIGLFNHTVTPSMEERTDEILKFLEIEHLEARPMTEMSSGEARRFLIGRALVHRPAALILPSHVPEPVTKDCAVRHRHHPCDAQPARYYSGDHPHHSHERRKVCTRWQKESDADR